MRRIKKFKNSEELLKAIEKQEAGRQQEKKKKVIVVSSGTCGQARGSLKVIEALKRALQEEGLKDQVVIRITGCHGSAKLNLTSSSIQMEFSTRNSLRPMSGP